MMTVLTDEEQRIVDQCRANEARRDLHPAFALPDRHNLLIIVDRLAAENARLTAELAETWETIVYSEGILIHDGDKAGWYDSCANSDVCLAGDSLVNAGLWERRPNGVGRRQFYRKKDAAVLVAVETENRAS